MNISVQKLLAKIEEELKLAQSSTKQESLREKVYSIKILSELILDEKPAPKSEAATIPTTAVQPVITQQPMITPQVFQQPAAKKLEMDNEANGDSLFDF